MPKTAMVGAIFAFGQVGVFETKYEIELTGVVTNAAGSVDKVRKSKDMLNGDWLGAFGWNHDVPKHGVKIGWVVGKSNGVESPSPRIRQDQAQRAGPVFCLRF
jgi:hypothetical protein